MLFLFRNSVIHLFYDKNKLKVKLRTLSINKKNNDNSTAILM